MPIKNHNPKTDKIYLNDSGADYLGWSAGDSCFKITTGLDLRGTLFCNDISGGNWTGSTIDATDYVETPIIRNTDGDTLTVQDNLDVTGLISATGLGLGIDNPARTLHIQDDNGVIRIDRDANSPAFILARFPNNDYSTPWKSFIFGVAADGSDDGTFHITDIHTAVSGGGDRRLTIENDGTVDIPGNITVGGTVDGVDLTSPVFTGNVLIGAGVAHDNFHIIDTSPSIILEESDASSSEKVWELTATGGMFKLLAQSDLYSATQTVMEIDRGGTSPTYISFPNSKVGIRTSNLSGQLTVDQANASGAIPVLTLDQGDVDQPFVEFLNGTVYGGMTGTNKYLKVKADGGGTYYLRLFD